jgi:hypothetical protein
MAQREQQYYVLGDDSYARMLAKLQAGSRFEWSYPGPCPTPVDCRCPRWRNVLKDGKIMRVVNGRWKPVYPLSAVLRGEAEQGV